MNLIFSLILAALRRLCLITIAYVLQIIVLRASAEMVSRNPGHNDKELWNSRSRAQVSAGQLVRPNWKKYFLPSSCLRTFFLKIAGGG